MSLNRRFLASLVACLFLVAGCGDKKDKARSGEAAAGAGAPAATTGSATTGAPATGAPASPPPPAAMMDLVPEGTVAVVYIPNVKALEDGVRRIASSVDGTKPPEEFSELAKELGVDGADVEWSRPAAIAVTQSAGSPGFGKTVIVPVKDEKAIAAKVKAKMADATVDAAGGFVAVTSEAPYKRAGPPPQFKAALPAGDVVVRIDVAALWKTFGPMATSQADAMLEQIGGAAAAGGVDPTASLKPMLDGLKSMLEASSVWDLAFRIDGTAVEMDLTARFVPGSKPAILDTFAKADLTALARAVPDEGPMMFAAAIDMSKFWAAMAPMIDSGLAVYPPADREKMKKLFEAMPEAIKTLGHGMAASGGIGPQGMSMVGVMETPDAGAYVKAMMKVQAPLDTKDGAISRTPPEERMVEGVKVTTIRMQFDAEKLKAMGGAGATPGAPDPARCSRRCGARMACASASPSSARAFLPYSARTISSCAASRPRRPGRARRRRSRRLSTRRGRARSVTCASTRPRWRATS